MQTLADLLNAIPVIDPTAMSRTRRHIDGLLKPVGSLGRLEALAIQLAGMPGLNDIPHMGKKAVLVTCANHGVWEEGVAISPKGMIAIQTENMTRGATGVCVLAAQVGANVHIVNVGIGSAELTPGLINMRVTRGNGNIASAPAMSRRQTEKLLLDVMCYTRELVENGITLSGAGELGMANTTSAAAVVSTVTGRDPRKVVGIGANLPTDKLASKIDVVRRVITLNQPNPQNGVDVLAKVGRFDLIGMAGAMLGAASCGLPVLLDRFLSYAATLATCQMSLAIKPCLAPFRLSAEEETRIALSHLGLEPYLNVEMHLGERSDTTLAIPIIEAVCTIYNNMDELATNNIVLPGDTTSDLSS